MLPQNSRRGFILESTVVCSGSAIYADSTQDRGQPGEGCVRCVVVFHLLHPALPCPSCLVQCATGGLCPIFIPKITTVFFMCLAGMTGSFFLSRDRGGKATKGKGASAVVLQPFTVLHMVLAKRESLIFCGRSWRWARGAGGRKAFRRGRARPDKGINLRIF